MKYRHLLLVLGVVGVALLAVVVVGDKQVESVQNITVAEPGTSLLPVRLMIPAIMADALVESVGLTPENLMDAPEGPTNVGWYNLGVRPGETGSAVIDGHSGWKDNIPAVFDDLHKLERGDKVYVEDEKSIITTFVVREIRVYDPKADASEVFFSTDGQSHLNLITCAGAWNEVSKSSAKRLVVFTDKVGSTVSTSAQGGE